MPKYCYCLFETLYPEMNHRGKEVLVFLKSSCTCGALFSLLAQLATVRTENLHQKLLKSGFCKIYWWCRVRASLGSGNQVSVLESPFFPLTLEQRPKAVAPTPGDYSRLPEAAVSGSSNPTHAGNSHMPPGVLCKIPHSCFYVLGGMLSGERFVDLYPFVSLHAVVCGAIFGRCYSAILSFSVVLGSHWDFRNFESSDYYCLFCLLLFFCCLTIIF